MCARAMFMFGSSNSKIFASFESNPELFWKTDKTWKVPTFCELKFEWNELTSSYIWLLAKRRKENKATRDQHSQRLCQCAFSSCFAFWRSLLMGLIEDLIGHLTAFWSLRLIELISWDCCWAFRMLIKTEMFCSFTRPPLFPLCRECCLPSWF